VAGWRGGQIGAIAVALVVGVGVLRVWASAVGAVVAVAALAIGVGVATWPIAGRTAEEWAPDAFRHVTLGLRSRAAPGPFAGVRLIRVDPSTAGSDVAADGGGAGIGVFHDRSRRTFTAVLGASDPGFVLLGEDEKAGRISAWSGVLASLAREGSSVHRLQWVERIVPADAAGVPPLVESDDRWPGGASARASYAALVEAESQTTFRHEVLLAVSIHAGRAARAVKSAGGAEAGACSVLLREVAALRRRLTDASMDVGAVLSPAVLATVVRDASELRGTKTAKTAKTAAGSPRGKRAMSPRRAHRAGAQSVESSRAGHELRPWPMGVEVQWGRLRADGTWHTTYWVAEWPRTDTGPDFLGPLLLSAEARRTMSVVMEPLGPIAASRQAEKARTADIADSELRRRGGFLATARRRREEEILARREIELADGHAQYRFSGYVTVSAPDPEALEEACGRVEQAAAQSGLELRRCYGDQANTFLCTLPLGRGLS
jgi:hypothetical protein